MAKSRICSIDGCDKSVRTLKSGLCNAHERRLKRHGDPFGGGTFRSPKADHCTVHGCNGDVFASGLCQKHYQRNRIHGDPQGGGTDKGALKKWILDHVDYAGGDCLLWPFPSSSDGHGYGHLYVDGATVRAHRYMCELANGPAPSPNHYAAHSCGNGHLGCINPNHLRWATPTENSADMILHGTRLQGEKAPWSKLTESDVRFIRAQRGKLLQRELAKMFGVKRSTIGAIQQRKRWAHLD